MGIGVTGAGSIKSLEAGPPSESVSHPYKFLELYTSTICPASATYRELRNFDGSEITDDLHARVFRMVIL